MLATALPTPVLLTFGAVFGAVIGSFLNVVIYRVPRGESLVSPGSRCPTCGEPVPFWANVPLLSWIALRGRCYRCSARISVRYPAVELATAVLFVALLWVEEPGVRLLADWLLVAALLSAALIDAEHQIIPNEITYPGIPLGIAFSLLAPPPSWALSLAGVALVGGMMWALSAGYEWRTGRIGLGMGDVKLVAMIAAFLGLQPALGVLVLGSLVGLAHGIAMMLLFGADRRTRIPFGPSLSLAGIAHVFWPELLPLLLGTG